jgi:uncharacterized RDD family membrane protein YckC
MLDLLWQSVPMVAAGVLALSLLPTDARPGRFFEKDALGQPRVPLLALAFVSAVIFFVNFGYFALFETVSNGRSPGKRALGLRVLRDGGYPLDGRAALVRNLLRGVDFMPAFYLVGILSLFVGRKGKRLGDYAAGTFVVKERKPDEYVSVVAQAKGGPLSPRELSLVVDFLSRRSMLNEAARMRVGAELAARVAARLGRPAPFDAEAFLEGLIRDEHR